MNHRHLLALLIICPHADIDRGGEGGEEESDGGGGHREGWAADGEGEPKTQQISSVEFVMDVDKRKVKNTFSHRFMFMQNLKNMSSSDGC